MPTSVRWFLAGRSITFQYREGRRSNGPRRTTMTPIEARPRGGWQQQLRVPSSAVTSCMPLTSHGAPSHSVPIHLPTSVLLSTQIELPLDADSNDLVFTGPGGGNGVPFGTRTILSRHGFRRLYQNAAHRARGDLAHLQLRGPHDLRHSFSTWLEDEGIPARVIDELMGHQRSRRGGAGRWQPHRRPLSAHHPRDGCPDRPSGRPPVGARPPDRASDHPQRNWTRAIGSSSEAEVHTGRGNRWWLGIGFERHADQGSTTSRRVVFWKIFWQAARWSEPGKRFGWWA
jgi:Phage integrase family